MTAPLLYPCDACGHGFEHGGLMLVAGRQLCSPCWVAAGRPWPRFKDPTPAEIHQAEAATRQRMLEHGGAFANAVRNGKT